LFLRLGHFANSCGAPSGPHLTKKPLFFLVLSVNLWYIRHPFRLADTLELPSFFGMLFSKTTHLCAFLGLQVPPLMIGLEAFHILSIATTFTFLSLPVASSVRFSLPIYPCFPCAKHGRISLEPSHLLSRDFFHQGVFVRPLSV